MLALEVGRIEHAGGNPETLKWRRRMLAHFDGLRRRPLANLRSADVGATLEAMARAGLALDDHPGAHRISPRCSNGRETRG